MASQVSTTGLNTGNYASASVPLLDQSQPDKSQANQYHQFAKDLSRMTDAAKNLGIETKNESIRLKKAQEDADEDAKKEKAIKDNAEAIRLHEVYRGSSWENIPTKLPKEVDPGFRKALPKGEDAKRLSNGELRDEYNLLRARDKIVEEQANIDASAEEVTAEFEAVFHEQKNTPGGINTWEDFAPFALAQHQRNRFNSNLARVDKIEEAIKGNPFNLSRYHLEFAKTHQKIIRQNQDLGIKDSLSTRGNPNNPNQLQDSIHAIATKPITTPNGKIRVISDDRVERLWIQDFTDQAILCTDLNCPVFDQLQNDGLFGYKNSKGARILFNRKNPDIADAWREYYVFLVKRQKEVEKDVKNEKTASKTFEQNESEKTARAIAAEVEGSINIKGVTADLLELQLLKLATHGRFFAEGEQNELLKTTYSRVQAKLLTLKPLAKEYQYVDADESELNITTKIINEIETSDDLVKEYSNLLTNNGKSYRNLWVTTKVAEVLVKRKTALVEKYKDPIITEQRKKASLVAASKVRTIADELVKNEDWAGLKILQDSKFPGVESQDHLVTDTYVRAQYAKKGLKKIQAETAKIVKLAVSVIEGETTLKEADAKVLVDTTSLADLEKYFLATKTLRKEGFENKGISEGQDYETKVAKAKTIKELEDIKTKASEDTKLGSKAIISLKKAINTRTLSFTTSFIADQKEQAKKALKDLSLRKRFEKNKEISKFKTSGEINKFLTSLTSEEKDLEKDDLIQIQVYANNKLKVLEASEGKKADRKLHSKYINKLLKFPKRPTNNQIQKLLEEIDGEDWKNNEGRTSLLATLTRYNDANLTEEQRKNLLAEEIENIRNAQVAIERVEQELDRIVQGAVTKGAVATLEAITEYRLTVDENGDFQEIMFNDPLRSNWAAVFKQARQDALSIRTNEQLADADIKNLKEHTANNQFRDDKEVDLRVKIQSFINNYDPLKEDEMITSLSDSGELINRQGHSTPDVAYLDVNRQVDFTQEIAVARTKHGSSDVKPPSHTHLKSVDEVMLAIENIREISTDRKLNINNALKKWRNEFLDGKVKISDYDKYHERLNTLRDSNIVTATPLYAGEDIINSAFRKETGIDAAMKGLYYENKNSQILRQNLITYFRQKWTEKAKALENENKSDEDILAEAHNFASSLVTPSEEHPMGITVNGNLEDHFATWKEISEKQRNRVGVSEGRGKPVVFLKNFKSKTRE